MKKIFILAVVIAMISSFSMQAHAALQNLGEDRDGNRLIYDSDLNITWYDYSSSPNLWGEQVNWASNLSVSGGDLAGVYNDWRLPNGPSSTTGGITTSEMGHLYVELGNNVTGDFLNLKKDLYWTGTVYPVMPFLSWNFSFYTGDQGVSVKNNYPYYALAVHPGQISTAAFISGPEPISSTLFVVGGAAMGFWRFRKKSRI